MSSDRHLSDGASSTSRARLVRVIGWYEVLAGVVGGVTFALLSLQHREALPGERFWIATLPFALLVTGGWALLNHKRSGLYLSLVLQTAQIVAWSLRGSVWKFSTGLYCSLGVVNGKFSLFAGWDTSFLVGYKASDQPAAVLVNVVPLVVALLLLRVWSGRRRYRPGPAR